MSYPARPTHEGGPGATPPLASPGAAPGLVYRAHVAFGLRLRSRDGLGTAAVGVGVWVVNKGVTTRRAAVMLYRAGKGLGPG